MKDTFAVPRQRQSPLEYSRALLHLYDGFVYGFSSPFLWRCPPPLLRAQYAACVGRDHLEIGVGTGYLLETARLTARPRVTLLDRNLPCLKKTAARLAALSPRTQEGDVFDLPTDIGPFTSIGMNYVMHCLPGDLRAMASPVARIAGLLQPDGVYFGSTIVQGEAPRGVGTQLWMNLFNRLGVFCNSNDRIEDLDTILRSNFATVDLHLRGCVALWQARQPRAR